MLIRRYEPEDREAVRRIHAAAFRRPDNPDGTPPEVGLLDDLIEAGDAVSPLSLVAVRQDGPVGHVVCSRATVGAHPVVALGPIGVLPNHQRHGVGLAMMHAALAAADALEIPLVALLGSRDYYPRSDSFHPRSSASSRRNLAGMTTSRSGPLPRTTPASLVSFATRRPSIRSDRAPDAAPRHARVGARWRLPLVE